MTSPQCHPTNPPYRQHITAPSDTVSNNLNPKWNLALGLPAAELAAVRRLNSIADLGDDADKKAEVGIWVGVCTLEYKIMTK